MSNINELKRKRGQVKSSLTRFKRFYESLNENQLDNKVICELKRRLDNLSPVLEQFNEIQSEIELHLEEAQVNAEESERVEFETMYYDLTGSVDQVLQKFAEINKSNSSSSSSASANNIESQLAHLNLPKMEVPKFNGNYNNWLEFKDAFMSLIGNTALSDVQKMYHLKNCLENEALDTIKAMPASAASYKAAWDALVDNYEKGHLIIRSHVRSIIDFPPITRESGREIKAMYNNINNNLQSLKSLEQPVEHWDTLLIPIITDKCDPSTKHEWERLCTRNDAKDKGSGEKLSDLLDLLKMRYQLLEKLEGNAKTGNKIGKFDSRKNQVYASTVSSKNMSCFYCKKDHSIYKCELFIKKPIETRISEIKRLKLCINCLRPNHNNAQCTSSMCRKCGKPHNSLLHLDNYKFKPPPTANTSNVSPIEGTAAGNVESSDMTASGAVKETGTLITHHTVKNAMQTQANISTSQVLLSTALILLEDSEGQWHQCRALLDSGSMSNFITSSLCEKLNLKLNRVEYAVTGVGKTVSNIKYVANLKISSRNKSFTDSIQCLVLPQITTNLPVITFCKNLLNIPNHLKLADPRFNESAPIDILLGSKTFWDLVCKGKLQLKDSQITLHGTKLGWIIAGHLQVSQQNIPTISCLSSNSNINLENELMKFWKIEEANFTPIKSQSEQYCETHFKNTHNRDKTGQFIVNIPFKENYTNLGQSRQFALNRFISQEKRLLKNPSLYIEYSKFMAEYIALSHMTEITETHENDEELNYYLPHHAVIKETSCTTKVRIVFDASMKTDSGLSLNDVQHVGPTIQPDLFTVLTRFRTYQFVMTADISKMYRMVWVEPDQTKFQRIFWRENITEEIKCYELKTVTYGTASAPYQAIRCLFQLAEEYEKSHPQASNVIKNSFYVDDLLCGANTESELLNLQRDVSNILSSAGFHLRKWLCNKKQLLDKFEVNNTLDSSILQLGENELNKTLGISWNAQDDTIRYTSSTPSAQSVLSKRTILSEIAQIFDPLGLLGPVIIISKLIIQKLWESKISWDEPVPERIRGEWLEFRSDLKHLQLVKIDRHVMINNIYCELHGFADASEKAFGACVYIRCKTKDGQFCTRLVCAKSRVAPLKRITLPRLELCSALLLAQLIQKIRDSININFQRQLLWSDSMVTLAWIQGDPSRWKTFVANRVSEIQRITNGSEWKHVSSKDNPADLLSRGTSVLELSKSSLWWSGPAWLKNDNFKNCHISENIPERDIPEQRVVVNLSVYNNCDLFDKYSSFSKLQKTIGWCLRFSTNCKLKKESRELQHSLTVNELQNAMKLLIKLAQQEHFAREYDALTKNKPLSPKSSLVTLNPFIHDKLLRVGGRLKQSNYEFDKKHPVILPAKHKITKLILRDEHVRLLHCGPTMLLSSIRERFWPISGRNLARAITRHCVVCFRVKPKSENYQMGNLPQARVQQYLPFFNTGVDYAGPFLLKDRFTRVPKFIKAYVCLFICLSTKAVHLEVVSDLTTYNFMACLKRFIARRGKPLHIYSDNATNFAGTCTELRRLQSFLENQNDYIYNTLSEQNITWHFIPARSPSFGGLWEAGIKSAKFHLKRVMGNAHLHFEDFNTILVQIEAILNSRPLCPITSNPDNLNPLTPGHFLIGRQLTAMPEPNYVEIKENRLTRFKRLQQMIQHFWGRWQKEYVNELQTRVKWKQNAAQLLQVDAVVIVKEDNIPPLQWQLGRITKLHPGEDGVCRVVSVKVKDSVVKRPVTKICVLPVCDSVTSEV